MHSNSLAKHFFHIFHATSLLPVSDALLLVSNRSQNFYQCSGHLFFYINNFLQNSDKISIRIPGQKSSQFVTWTVGNFQMVVETQGSSCPMINNFFNQWTYWEVYILQFNFFWQLNDLQTQLYTLRTVNSKCLLSFLLNWFKLDFGLFGQINTHQTLDFCPDQTRQEGIESNRK